VICVCPCSRMVGFSLLTPISRMMPVGALPAAGPRECRFRWHEGGRGSVASHDLRTWVRRLRGCRGDGKIAGLGIGELRPVLPRRMVSFWGAASALDPGNVTRVIRVSVVGHR
jgi:hypothetical protein